MIQSEAANAAEQPQIPEKGPERVRDLVFDSLAEEFIQPLNLIGIEREFLQLHLKNTCGGEPDEKITQALDGIAAATANLTRLVNNCCDTAAFLEGRAAPQPVPLDLCALVRDVCADAPEIGRSLGVVLRAELPDAPCCVLADQTMAQRVLLNLLSNALRACGRGGEVVLSLRVEKTGALLCVRDDGCGVPKEFYAHAFAMTAPEERPNRARYLGGAGLGLFLVGECCRRLGWLPVMRAAAPGTCVELRIPASRFTGGEKLVFRSDAAAQSRREAMRAAVRAELLSVPGLEKLGET